MKNSKINVQGSDITIYKNVDEDYISLTDIAKHKTDDTSAVIANWMRNRNTIEFLGIWETLYNPDFKPLEFEGFRNQAGLNAFTLSPQKWVNTTNAKGFVVKSGRYGGTYAHKDIAFKFASWISVEFELYIVKEFQRLKEEEQKQLGWTANLENLNAVFINEEMPQSEHLSKLNQIAINQMNILLQQDAPLFLEDKKGGNNE